LSTERELDLVELVSPTGEAVGSATVAQAHTVPGSLHRAFSVLLFDAAGRTLLQRRAATKTRFPLRWANACCGHPAPGEVVVAAATRRLADELGVPRVALAHAGVHTYEAVDPTSGRIEREFDHVLVGRVSADLTILADPAEVADTRWVTGTTRQRNVTGAAVAECAPWLPGVFRIALASPLLRDLPQI